MAVARAVFEFRLQGSGMDIARVNAKRSSKQAQSLQTRYGTIGKHGVIT